MTETYDVTESLFAGKADENMIAFCGFSVFTEEGETPCDGVLKIASLTRHDQSGYLTLTLIMDTEADPARRARLKTLFARLDQGRFASDLGGGFEMVLAMPLDPFVTSRQFYVEELNLYFRNLAGHERTLLEGSIMPVLTRELGLRFDRLEWLNGLTERTGSPSPERSDTHQPLSQRLRHWWLKQTDTPGSAAR
ncbi:MAG: hypothetical protein EOM91_10550 [Sphingobacteriia bacterium]|nr:hypothetical protein [Sphingobacteriia bacterium]NCC41088.1 hypothetical protein [Gammaproteobacteria bacterium]